MQLPVSELIRISASLRRFEGRARAAQDERDFQRAYVNGVAGCASAADDIEALINRVSSPIPVVDDVTHTATGKRDTEEAA